MLYILMKTGKLAILVACSMVMMLPARADQFDEMTSPQIDAILQQGDLVIMPLGATEQTGPYNPTGSDYFIANEVASRVGKIANVLVTPVVSVGVSEKHRHFPGTLSVPRDVFYSYVKHQVLSLKAQGVTKVLFINGHGGNNNVLFDLTGDLRRNHNMFVAVVGALPENSPLITQMSDISHGGWAMTSVGLFLYPELIKNTDLENVVQQKEMAGLALKGENRIGPEGGPYAKFDADAIDLTENGVLGGAGLTIGVTQASAEKGKQLIEPHIHELSKLVEALKRADIKGLRSKTLN